MKLTQCNGLAFFYPRRVGLLGKRVVPCDAPLALGVDHVALALDGKLQWDYEPFYRALLQKRPVILRSLLIEATG